MVVLVAPTALAGHFDGWRKFGEGVNGSKWYYFPASVKPIHHDQTGKYLGEFVWAGSEAPGGSYDLAHYMIHCANGTFMVEGHVAAASNGSESDAGGDYDEEPYQPETFVWVLAEIVCGKSKG
jgi:hypothetical protein